MACACSALEARWKQWRIIREPTTERIIDLRERPLSEAKAPESWITRLLEGSDTA
jgi:hypothetical protein